MSGYANPDRPEQRLSDAERDEAVGRLAQANVEGRLTTEEFGERSAAARRAVTRGDLVPLFADLPESTAPEQEVPLVTGPGVPLPPPPPPTSGAASPAYGSSDVDTARASRALGGRVGATIMALTPFIAVALFFITGFNGSFAWSWLWFLLVPVVGIVIYGPGSDGRRSRR